jgi:hypothetical protein
LLLIVTVGATGCSALPRLLQQHRNRGFLTLPFGQIPSPRTACVTAQAVWNTLATAPDQGDGLIMHKADERRQWFCSEYFYSLHFCHIVWQSVRR